MYPPVRAAQDPQGPAVIMAASGATQTYAELDQRSARLATWLRGAGLDIGDVVMLALEKNLRWGEICWACWRTGLVVSAVNWHLTPRELAPLVEDAAPRVVVTSAALALAVRAAVELAGVPSPRYLVVGEDYDAVVAATSPDPHLSETMGGRLLFSSGSVGAVWFVRPDALEPVRAADGSADLAAMPGWGAVGDIGRLDEDGFLYLTGRAGQTIISGGVNIYPREIEDVFVLHPAVADVAVIGVPDEEFGEQVKAVVQLVEGTPAADDLAAELIGWCRERIAHFKCPRSVDVVDVLPRSDAGKVLVAPLRERYARARSMVGTDGEVR